MKIITLAITICGLTLSACSKDNTPTQVCSAYGTNVDQADFQIGLHFRKKSMVTLISAYDLETDSKTAPDSIGAFSFDVRDLCEKYPIDVFTGKGSLVKFKIKKDIGGCKEGSEVLFTPVYNSNGLDTVKATGTPECLPRLYESDADIRKNTTVTPQQATAPQIMIVGQWSPDEASEPYSVVVKGDGTYQIIGESETTEGKWKKNDDGTYTLVDAMGMLGDYVKLEMVDGKPKMTTIYQGQVSSTYTKGNN